MENKDEFKEVCELLKIWYYIESNKMVWTDAKTALEKRINHLLDENQALQMMNAMKEPKDD